MLENMNPDDMMQQIRANAGGRKVVLNVGCGAKRPERLDPRFRDDTQWFELRLDMDVKAQPDIVADLTDLHMFPEGAVSAIHAAHNLEHLEAHRVVPTLKGFYRVLSWGGQLVVHTPDIQTIAAFIAQGKLEQPLYTAPGGPVAPIDMLYGMRSSIARGDGLMAHRTGFTCGTLAEKLKEAGFCNILIVRDRFDLMGLAWKLPSNHTQRRATVELKVTERYNPREAVVASADNVAQLAHPGQMHRGVMPDELDVPPAM